MKRIPLLKILSTVLVVSLLAFSCSSCKKSENTAKTRVTTEEEDDEEETTKKTTQATVPSPTLDVFSLDQFISDGSLFAEDVIVPTPTPIPVEQKPLGLENNGKGYYSGPLENVTVIDNEFFRYTIFNVEKDDEHYYVNGEFENKSDVAFGLRFKNPTVENETNSFQFYLDAPIAPHTTIPDTTDFAKCVKNYSGQDLTRISFLLLATDPEGQGTIIPISESKTNYVLVNLFPQGEDAFVYQESALPDTADIVVDTEGALLSIDSFDLTSDLLVIHYSFRNKTGDYLQFKLKDETIMVDDTVFDEVGHQSVYIAPYSTLSDYFSIRLERFDKVKLDPKNAKSITLPVIANSLTDEIKTLWERMVKAEIEFG